MNPATSEFLIVQDGNVKFKPGPEIDSSSIWIVDNSHIISLQTGQYLTAGDDGKVYLKDEKSDLQEQSWLYYND
jgi:hypothetical protein